MENKSTWPTNTIIRSSNILSHSVLATSVNLHFHQQGHRTKERLFAKGKIMKRKHNLKLRTFSFSELLLSLKLITSHPLSFSTMLNEACILFISLFFYLFIFFYLLLWQDLNLSKGRKPPPWIKKKKKGKNSGQILLSNMYCCNPLNIYQMLWGLLLLFIAMFYGRYMSFSVHNKISFFA